MAQNARRHGATSKPDPTSVAAWLKIILDTPDLNAGDMLGDDIRIYCALALAEAEVRMWTTQSALDAFERGDVSGSDTVQALQHCAESINELLWDAETTVKKRRSGLSLLGRIEKSILADTAHGGPRHRLLQRYNREAHGHRKRAFEAWLICLQQPDVRTDK